jgi:hypothetical protein
MSTPNVAESRLTVATSCSQFHKSVPAEFFTQISVEFQILNHFFRREFIKLIKRNSRKNRPKLLHKIDTWLNFQMSADLTVQIILAHITKRTSNALGAWHYGHRIGRFVFESLRI